jgi:hypothetical protein
VTDKIFIALPAFGQQVNSQTTASIVALTKELAERQMFGGFSSISFPDIADLRNVFLSVWYDTMDASHILMVDADMQFEPALVRDMILADKPLVGCIYPKKRLPIGWVGSALTPPAEPEGNLLELEGIGFGVTLIRRDCIDSMISSGTVEVEDEPTGVAAEMVQAHGGKRMIHAFDLIRDGKRRLSEDFSFCKRHRDSGGKVYAVINQVLTHLGLYQFSSRYSDMYKARAT